MCWDVVVDQKRTLPISLELTTNPRRNCLKNQILEDIHASLSQQSRFASRGSGCGSGHHAV